MWEFFIAVFLLAVLVVAAYLFWRAYQLGVKQRVALAEPWRGPVPENVEQLVPLFARRDLALAVGCLLFVLLALWMPQRFGWWFLLLLVFGGAHYGYTRHAFQRLGDKG